MSSKERPAEPEVPAKARTRRYAAGYKAKILDEYEVLDKAGKGSLLRREGLYTSLIAARRSTATPPYFSARQPDRGDRGSR